MSRERIWDRLLTERDRQVVVRGGYGKRRGAGKRPALILIDLQYNYAGEDKPILDQLEEWPSGCGEMAWRAVENIAKLARKARDCGVPVIYTRNVQKEISFDSFGTKTMRSQSRYVAGHPGTRIVPAVAPEPGDLVLDKAYASAFFGTPLISWVVKMGVDTLVIAGGTTSGCVRATAVDAVSRNFDTVVVEECVFDRIELSHCASLFDLWMKYADVVGLEEAMQYLEGIAHCSSE
ncbi:MAG: isochorismatase family protein [Ignavibacteriales bacterium]